MSNNKPKILLIDDELIFLKSLQLVLREQYDCQLVSDSSQAIIAFHADPPSIVLCDVNLKSEVNGFEICRQIKAFDVNVPIVLLTNYRDKVSRLTGLSVGVDHYLCKLVTNEELLFTIRNLLVTTGRVNVSEIMCNYKADFTEHAGFLRQMNDVFDSLINGNEDQDINDLSVKNVADAMNMSTRSFQRKMLMTTNQSFRAYKQNYLIDSAVDYIINPRYTMLEIANILGFSSQSHFSLIFKNKFGLTPVQYRISRLAIGTKSAKK